MPDGVQEVVTTKLVLFFQRPYAMFKMVPVT